MDILKKASRRSSPKIVALQIKKYAPRNHPKTKKYLKLLSSFGMHDDGEPDAWLCYTPISPREKAVYEEILSISAASSQQHSPSGETLENRIKIAKKLIQDEQEKTDRDPQTLEHLKERLRILNLMKNRDPHFLAHVNFQVLGGAGNYSGAR